MKHEQGTDFSSLRGSTKHYIVSNDANNISVKWIPLLNLLKKIGLYRSLRVRFTCIIVLHRIQSKTRSHPIPKSFGKGAAKLFCIL